jgi:4-hydroxybenzoate polyprenyltransferase
MPMMAWPTVTSPNNSGLVVTAVAPPRGLGRWWVYQRERFPIFGHGPLIAAFSSGAVCFSAQLRARQTASGFSVAIASLVVAFLSSLLFFFQLRVSDEFKDVEDDTRWRPYRPVPRGLVTLRELGWLALGAGAVQFLLALWLSPRLIVPLLAVWAYMGLMTKEFWLKQWLRGRPLTVLWSHMLIMPFIDFYATACDWLVHGAGRAVGSGLAWFLAASYVNGVVVEIGRKIRAPADEEEGVETYSAVWGRRRAVLAWLGAIAATTLFATLAARDVGKTWPVLALLGTVAIIAAAEGVAMVRSPRPGRGKHLETLAGVWTIVMYLGVGVFPLLFKR